MITTYKTQALNFSEDVNELLCKIDVKLTALARKKLDSDRFGAKVHVNIEDHELLYKYREILYSKAKGNACFRNFLIDDIISRIKQLLNRN
jgi:hypothetical protein